jgi:hypothetical protein
MRNLDKKYHKALKFFDKHTKSKLIRLKQEEPEKYRKYVVEDIELDLVNIGYIDTNPENNSTYALTPKGQAELRVLDGLITNKTAVIISIVALLIAVLSIIIDMYKGG